MVVCVGGVVLVSLSLVSCDCCVVLVFVLLDVFRVWLLFVFCLALLVFGGLGGFLGLKVVDGVAIVLGFCENLRSCFFGCWWGFVLFMYSGSSGFS